MKGLRFQRRIPFGPGRVNLSTRGLSSVSFGRRGLWLTFGRRNQATVGLPGSGLRYTAPLARKNSAGRDLWGWLLFAFVAAIFLLGSIR
jgi:hypothetical protein